ncbi:MAG: HlyD family efflux transporter periplasmic adaptor subunit [Magnetococcales bacterium]|nr:HlyD family efflux transporter periplasmic adaptor subunit [Magnetococcales bacterium]
MQHAAFEPVRIPFPPLRPDLQIHPGPVGEGGAPSWTLFDPLRQRFFQLGWVEHAIVSHWSGGDAEAIFRAAREVAGSEVSRERIGEVGRFLLGNELLTARDAGGVGRLTRRAAAGREHWLVWLFHRYLYLRIPLWRPDRWLERWLPVARWFVGPLFLTLLLATGGVGFYLTLRHWDRFLHALPDHPTPASALGLALAVWIAKSLHELAHAFVARHYGCRVAGMGVAWIVLWPVLYADTSEVWKLTSRQARLIVGVAGVGAELALALLATFAWHFPAPGALQDGLALLASVTWLSTLAVNLNPCMRFDGYYLLSDALSIPNLAPRAFALASWWWRERLFAPGDPPPEPWDPQRRRWLLLYAHVTWVYRLTLFLGIALLVYHAFFKVLGLVLMSAEIGWFVVRPVVNFFRSVPWQRIRPARLLITLTGCAGAIGLGLHSWQQALQLPALLSAREQIRLYAPEPGRIATLMVSPGMELAAGAPVITLEAPDLTLAARENAARIRLLELEIAQTTARPALLGMRFPLERRLGEARGERQGIEARQAMLRIVAPFAGRVTVLGEGVAPGRWVARNTPLLEIVSPDRMMIVAWVPETDLERLNLDAPARFYPLHGQGEPFPVRLLSLDKGAVATLDPPHAAALHGGPIPARSDHSGRIVPNEAWYQARFLPDAALAAPVITLPGTVRLPGKAQSLFEQALRAVVAVWIRESGT